MKRVAGIEGMHIMRHECSRVVMILGGLKATSPGKGETSTRRSDQFCIPRINAGGLQELKAQDTAALGYFTLSLAQLHASNL